MAPIFFGLLSFRLFQLISDFVARFFRCCRSVCSTAAHWRKMLCPHRCTLHRLSLFLSLGTSFHSYVFLFNFRIIISLKLKYKHFSQNLWYAHAHICCGCTHTRFISRACKIRKKTFILYTVQAACNVAYYMRWMQY